MPLVEPNIDVLERHAYKIMSSDDAYKFINVINSRYRATEHLTPNCMVFVGNNNAGYAKMVEILKEKAATVLAPMDVLKLNKPAEDSVVQDPAISQFNFKPCLLVEYDGSVIDSTKFCDSLSMLTASYVMIISNNPVNFSSNVEERYTKICCL